jgi:hypothetical protein
LTTHPTVSRVPEPAPPSGHEFKYRLSYVVSGECVVRYDNERGKGDHRYFGELEFEYAFSNPDQLMLTLRGGIMNTVILKCAPSRTPWRTLHRR